VSEAVAQQGAHPRKSVGVAAALWFFLGFFGAHRFYLGRIGTGAAQLALCVIGTVLALLDPATLPHPQAANAVLLVLAVWVIMDFMLVWRLYRDQRSRNQPVIA
jgi:hypothetical protein